jgi:hypothetical protein
VRIGRGERTESLRGARTSHAGGISVLSSLSGGEGHGLGNEVLEEAEDVEYVKISFHCLQLNGKKDGVPRHEGREVSWRCSGVNDVTCADGSRCISPGLGVQGF